MGKFGVGHFQPLPDFLEKMALNFMKIFSDVYNTRIYFRNMRYGIYILAIWDRFLPR